ncbi:hypothetical protein HME7025_02492 [Aquirufa nivalisilvae]|uniref:Methyltransferase FkbM domain-containing protein n=1 Tax=Aquirufa nivalisilvae TaxID=2516557 RepID=A0A2S2DYF8_9BACT|nr:FkbM family methyltransferase [Aquirufa nivalisilvae]AWL10332.1 hypothetical protein HME7025_02492 [Aquirufa nivalisilvae]
MKKIIKSFLKFLMIPHLYFGLKKYIRVIIELNFNVHLVFSKIAFSIRNIFQFNIHRVPFFISKELNSNSVVIDCGANVGAIMKPLLKYEPSIYCFEPNPVAFKQLSENLGTAPNLHLINKAVGIETKTAKLYLHKEAEQNELLFSVSSSLLSSKPNVDNSNFYEVEVLNFLDFLKSLGKNIQILKVDIEGAEVELINALLDAGLDKKIQYIFVETHENTIPDLVESTLQLKKRTFQMNVNNIYYNWA